MAASELGAVSSMLSVETPGQPMELQCPPAEETALSPAFRCPITSQIFEDPVSLVDGSICERRAVELWFSRGHHVSPLTGVLLPSMRLTPVSSLQRTISVYVERYPEHKRDSMDQAAMEKCIDELEKQSWLQEAHPDPGMKLQAERVEDLINELRFGDSTQQEHVLRVLESLVVFNPGQKLVNNDNKRAVRRAGGFAVLTNILSNGTPTQKEVVANIMWKCAVEENTVAIRQAGAILPLKRLAEEGTPVARENAIAAMKMLDDLRVEHDFKHIVRREQNPIHSIASLVETLQAAEEALHDASGFDSFYLNDGIEGALQHLGDLALVSPENPVVIKNAFGIPPTVAFLQKGTLGQKEAAARLILNLSVQDNEEVLRAEGVVDALRALEYEASGTARSNAQSALYVLAKLDADRRCLEAVVNVERNRYSVTYSS